MSFRILRHEQSVDYLFLDYFNLYIPLQNIVFSYFLVNLSFLVSIFVEFGVLSFIFNKFQSSKRSEDSDSPEEFVGFSSAVLDEQKRKVKVLKSLANNHRERQFRRQRQVPIKLVKRAKATARKSSSGGMKLTSVGTWYGNSAPMRRYGIYSSFPSSLLALDKKRTPVSRPPAFKSLSERKTKITLVTSQALSQVQQRSASPFSAITPLPEVAVDATSGATFLPQNTTTFAARTTASSEALPDNFELPSLTLVAPPTMRCADSLQCQTPVIKPPSLPIQSFGVNTRPSFQVAPGRMSSNNSHLISPVHPSVLMSTNLPYPRMINPSSSSSNPTSVQATHDNIGNPSQLLSHVMAVGLPTQANLLNWNQSSNVLRTLQPRALPPSAVVSFVETNWQRPGPITRPRYTSLASRVSSVTSATALNARNIPSRVLILAPSASAGHSGSVQVLPQSAVLPATSANDTPSSGPQFIGPN